MAYEVPWTFYALLPLFVLGFVLLAGSIGALLCLLIVTFLPRQPKQMVLAAVLLVLLVVVGLAARAAISVRSHSFLDHQLVRELVGQVDFAQGSMMPTHWMTRGLQAAARGDLSETGYRLALVWSNGLFLYLLTASASVRFYRRGFNRVAAGGSLRRRYGGAWMDAAWTRCSSSSIRKPAC